MNLKIEIIGIYLIFFLAICGIGLFIFESEMRNIDTKENCEEAGGFLREGYIPCYKENSEGIFIGYDVVEINGKQELIER